VSSYENINVNPVVFPTPTQMSWNRENRDTKLEGLVSIVYTVYDSPPSSLTMMASELAENRFLKPV
jgi:hypothetical protein